MRIAVADDSTLFRTALCALFELHDITVLFHSGDGDSFVEQVDTMPPDVAIVDIRMPPSWNDEGLRVAEHIKNLHPDIGVLILSGFVDLKVAARLLDLNSIGGVGYLLKDRVNDIGEFLATMTRIKAGDVVIDPELLDQLFGRSGPRALLEPLSSREREILDLIAKGFTNSGIGEILDLSQRTVENHVARIFTKLDIPSDARINRRVNAVLTWLRAADEPRTPPPPRRQE